MSEIDITQEDREAAAKALGYCDYADAIDYRLSAAQDASVSSMVQAFARHRQAARERALDEAAKVADRFILMTRASPFWEERTSNCLEDIATAIRNLAERGE